MTTIPWVPSPVTRVCDRRDESAGHGVRVFPPALPRSGTWYESSRDRRLHLIRSPARQPESGPGIVLHADGPAPFRVRLHSTHGQTPGAARLPERDAAGDRTRGPND